MRILLNPLVQILIVAVLGSAAGLIVRHHRASEIVWSSTHYRMDETVGFPMSRGIPFRQQYILDGDGARIEVPLKEGQEIGFNDATWWNVDDSGRMRTWNEDRVEVFPVITSP